MSCSELFRSSGGDYLILVASHIYKTSCPLVFSSRKVLNEIKTCAVDLCNQLSTKVCSCFCTKIGY